MRYRVKELLIVGSRSYNVPTKQPFTSVHFLDQFPQLLSRQHLHHQAAPITDYIPLSFPISLSLSLTSFIHLGIMVCNMLIEEAFMYIPLLPFNFKICPK